MPATFGRWLKSRKLWRRSSAPDKGGPPEETSSSPKVRPADEPHVVYVAFGTPDFATLLQRSKAAAERFGITDIRIYTPEHPVLNLAASENPGTMALPRGFGCWLWKPYILLDAMEHSPAGSVIIYADADMRLIADPAPLIARATSRNIVLFDNRPGRLQRYWTKRDCFVLMDADRSKHWERLQLMAGLQVYRASSVARNFLEEAKAAICDPRILTDRANVCGRPNLEGFIEHRHDQSVLTVLAVKHGIETLQGSSVDVAYGYDYPGKAVYFEHWRKTTWKRGRLRVE